MTIYRLVDMLAVSLLSHVDQGRDAPPLIQEACFLARMTTLVAALGGATLALFLASPVSAHLMRPPTVSAKAAIVIDGATGQILYAKNVHDRHPQASTTKMMAALVALEHGHLQDLVQVSKKSQDTAGSSLYLEQGERLTFEQLLYGMLLVSGNDATNAVAEYISGDADKFVQLMNQKAQQLGLKDTHYADPHGLPVPNHYSSAYDLAQIARDALANPEFAKVASTVSMDLPGNHRIRHRHLLNHNKLLRYFPGAWGGKTGYTTVAGKCFVGSAKRDGRYVIEAILGDPQCWRDAEHLLNYGLDAFTSEPLASAGQAIASVRVAGGRSRSVEAVLRDPITLSVPKGQVRPSVQTSFHVATQLKAPVSQGQVLGSYELRNGDRLIADAPLVAASAVPAGSPAWSDFEAVFGWFLKGGTLSVALYSVLRYLGLRRRRLALRRRSLPSAIRR